MAVIRNLQHLLAFPDSILAHAAVPRRFAAVPVLKRSFFAVCAGPDGDVVG